ncbi:MAG: radical SAM protein [Armatimonadota bacterium]
MAYPNVYRVGIASLGYQVVYRLLNELPDVSCERVFLPEPADLHKYCRTRTRLFTFETQTSLSDFDVVAFSVAFELDYLNILKILRLSQIPIRSSERGDQHPLVIAGGSCATFNPEPLAEFVDAFVIGDAEEVISPLAQALVSSAGARRHDRLVALAGVESVYVPAFYQPQYNSSGKLLGMSHSSPAPDRIKRAVCRDLLSYPGESVVITPESEFGAVRLIEVVRGCGRGCRFCVTGYVTRPPRLRDLDLFSDEYFSVSSLDNIALVGASIFDHPEAVSLCKRILASGRSFQVASLRLDTVTNEVASLIAASGQKTLTIAPESGTERLRHVIGKACSEEQIELAVQNAVSAGLKRVKLYFMVGLPTETAEDVEAIAELVTRLAGKYRTVDFEVSVTPFVPKPWTPFQWYPMATEKILRYKCNVLLRSLRKVANVNLTTESPRLSITQGLLARGDRAVGSMLELALTFDGDYRAALRSSGVDLEKYIYRHRAKEEIFPWDHIDVGIEKDWLWQQYQLAISG